MKWWLLIDHFDITFHGVLLYSQYLRGVMVQWGDLICTNIFYSSFGTSFWIFFVTYNAVGLFLHNLLLLPCAFGLYPEYVRSKIVFTLQGQHWNTVGWWVPSQIKCIKVCWLQGDCRWNCKCLFAKLVIIWFRLSWSIISWQHVSRAYYCYSDILDLMVH